MADDGMLLNFDTAASVAVSKPKVTGGRWKDRLQVRRGGVPGRRARNGGDNANYTAIGQRNVKDTGPSQSKETEPSGERPLKRQKTDNGARSIGTSTSKSSNGGGKEVVSSLFTFNPKSTSAPNSKGQGEEVPDVAPSNAPLPEGAANFTSLGLSPALATHLLTKLELKAPTAIQKAAVSQLLTEDSDAFIQAETGSGKTLAYLLPIVERLMAMSKGQVHRDSGLFAIIIAPTRELCRQIQAVLDSLLRCAHWIVAGSVTGGERKKSEKARLRKGINILVATPGRLADHLQNTSVLDVSKVKWLVMDEGDRLMELGFEQEIKQVVEALEKKESRETTADASSGTKLSLQGLPRRRVTVLCSATMKMNVQRLGEVSLTDAVHLQAGASNVTDDGKAETKFMAPAQMKQSYIIVPAKQRLVTLAALLRKTFARRGSVMKAIVFLSCADSVDFHFELFRRGADELPKDNAALAEPQQTASPPPSSPEPVRAKPISKSSAKSAPALGPVTSSKAPLLAFDTNPHLHLFRLHGSLAQPVRTSTLRAFSKTNDPAILLCTDVASRGLDLPSIDLVIEYDPAFSAEDHLHRVGRTARAGKEGRAILFLQPGPEEGYVELLEKEGQSEEGGKRKLGRMEVDDTLKRGFGEDEAVAKARAQTQTQSSSTKASKFVPSAGSNKEWEQRATEWQLEAERWALSTENRKAHDMAEKAYKSSVAAYATHVKPERHMFDVSELHLGHLAKAFALRDKPGNFGRGTAASKKKGSRAGRSAVGVEGVGRGQKRGAGDDSDDDIPRRNVAVDEDAMAKMRKLARARENDAAGEFNFG